MAELTHFYNEENAVGVFDGTTYTNTMDSGSNPAQILGTALAANTKYLIVARALVRGQSANNVSGVRVQTDDDSTIASKSEMLFEPESNLEEEGISYLFTHSYTTDASPADIEIQVQDGGGVTVQPDQSSLFLLDLDAIGSEGTDYYEDIQAVDTGTEYSTSAQTTVLAQLSGSDLGTDEFLVLGYARADVGSAGRWYDHAIYSAYDTSTATEHGAIRAEGEDTTEQRITPFAIRHQASSGTPNVTIYGTEEAANGNMTDGGAYLIALPVSLFADFEQDYQSTNGIADGVEETVASVGPYTPTTNGNHLIFGGYSGRNNVTADNSLHVEEGTTEIRTGDIDWVQNQTWDAAKDREHARTFQRYSISSEVTLNLRANVVGANRNVDDIWLVVVNLNAPGSSQTLTGVLFSNAPTFIVGQIKQDQTITGVLFSNPPAFIAGQINMALAGVLFSNPPVFPTGQLNLTLNGVLFSNSPAFLSGVITPGGVTVSGVLFSNPPTFIAGQLNLRVFAGAVFANPPTFISGTITATYDLSGVLMAKPPTFVSGTIASAYNIVGVLFARPPTFIAGQLNLTIRGAVFSAPPSFVSGTITPGNVTLSGVLLSKPPAFIAGVITLDADVLDGVLFVNGPTFIAGQINLTIHGVLYSNPPSFPTGTVAATYDLSGVTFTAGPSFIAGQLNLIIRGAVFANAPTFPTGTITPGGVSLAGVLFSKPPTFVSGQINLHLSGVLFSNPPVFPTGSLTTAYTLSGVLFVNAPTFLTGQLNLTLLGVVFSNPPVFITGSLIPSFNMLPTGDGTITDVVNELDNTTNMWQSVDDTPSSPTDTDWVNNTDADGLVFFDVTDTPADFDTANNLSMVLRWRGQNWSGASLTLYAQLFQSDESTVLSDEMTVVTVSANGSFANTSTITFTGLVAGSKPIWDAARIRLRWG